MESITIPGRKGKSSPGRYRPERIAVFARPRKSGFIKLFDQNEGLVCNRFYRLLISQGCPFNCYYCYLRLIFGPRKGPVAFTNPWPEVERQLEKITGGVFSTGELADSLAVTPPLLIPALDYFRRQSDKFLFLTTKSANITPLLETRSTPQVWISFSVNAVRAWELFEEGAPHPEDRVAAAWRLKEAGWRVRVRIDPIIPELGLQPYLETADLVRTLAPERVTLGLLKQFPRRPRIRGLSPWKELQASPNGLKRYPFEVKARVFQELAARLGTAPGLCRETPEFWEKLGWEPAACNCTPESPAARPLAATGAEKIRERGRRGPVPVKVAKENPLNV